MTFTGLLRNLLPRPWTALWLWLTWLLLNQSVAPAQLLLGGVLAIALARWASTHHRLAHRSGRAPLGRRIAMAARLVATVFADIVTSNRQVARLILGRTDQLKPGFVWVRLDLQQPGAINLLCAIVTMTPGTVSAELSDDRKWLLVHGLDVGDPPALAALIKARYETPVREIFE
ncbi:MAG: Na+/H+ antiporter subunit E [Burkholderiales bacterium]|jgi:multicomponent K+:H+ antiporter subunit E|nr:Na+/H+ antiporter subunit E [Burkholderiales bacterium]